MKTLPLYPHYQPEFCQRDIEEAQKLVKKHSAGQTQVVRARLLLILAEDPKRSSPSIARELAVHEQTVRKWRKRWTTGEVTLKDNPRSGRRGDFSPLQQAAVKAIACELPASHHLPFSRFSTTDIAQLAIEEGIVSSISATTVWRWLEADGLKPWYQQSWVFPRDPQFLQKAAPVLDLYHQKWQGCQLTDGDFVISADEKPIQALARCGRLPAGSGRIGRYDYEYERKGVITYLAALDVASGTVIGQTDSSNGIAPFTQLVTEVMNTDPYKSANRVFWIVDNGCAHHPSTFPARLATAHHNAIAVQLPTHASWLNQVEIYFSILTRKLLKPNDFRALDELISNLHRFEEIYNDRAKPFNWKFTKMDLFERFKHLEQPYAKL